MSRYISTAGEQVAELADRSAEAGRLSRGRTLFRKGSVSELSVLEGSIIASVRGSQGDQYETTVGTSLAPPGVMREVTQAQHAEHRRSVDELIEDGVDVCPRGVDLAFGCDCGDWDEPCKHVVAVLLAFADRVDLDDAELLRWRGIDLSASTSDGSDVPPQTPAASTSPPTSSPAPAKAATPNPASTERWPRTADLAPTDERADPTDHDIHAEPEDKTTRLNELEALLGDTVMKVPTADGAASDAEPEAMLTPAMADFLGVGMTIVPVDVSQISVPGPLFADVQLGPLADLGPELAKAVATIIARLEDVSAD